MTSSAPPGLVAPEGRYAFVDECNVMGPHDGALRLVSASCVHEHVGKLPVCERHLSDMADRWLCSLCKHHPDSPHRCEVRIHKVEPYTGVDQ